MWGGRQPPFKLSALAVSCWCSRWYKFYVIFIFLFVSLSVSLFVFLSLCLFVSLSVSLSHFLFLSDALINKKNIKKIIFLSLIRRTSLSYQRAGLYCITFP